MGLLHIGRATPLVHMDFAILPTELDSAECREQHTLSCAPGGSHSRW